MTTLKRYEGGRIKGGCSLHDAEKPELCQKHLQRCPEPRTVDCCDYCDDGDGHSIFPYYGTAPHIHAGGDGWIGSTQLLPRAMWIERDARKA